MTTLLVDQDGPLADFDRRFFDRVAANGWRMDEGVTLETQRHRFASNHMPDRRERALARSMVYDEPWFHDLPVVEGALEGMQRFVDLGLDVWIVTKPLEANQTCRDDKARWLVKHFGREWEKRLILTPDKSMVRGDILLDDAPKPAWYPRAEWRPVIFSTPYNGAGSEWEGVPRWTWGDPIENLLTVTAYERDRLLG